MYQPVNEIVTGIKYVENQCMMLFHMFCQVEYDFQFYKMEMPADVPVLVLSQVVTHTNYCVVKLLHSAI